MANDKLSFNEKYGLTDPEPSSVERAEEDKGKESRGFVMPSFSSMSAFQSGTDIGLAEAERESIAPSQKKYTMKSLLDEDDWINSARVIYEKEKGKKWRGENKELGEWFRRRHARLGNDLSYLAYTAARAKKFSPKVKSAWVKSLDMYQDTESDIGSFGRASWQMLSDPTFGGSIAGTVGIGTLPRILGGRLAGQLGKFQFKKQLVDSLSKEVLKNIPASTLRGRVAERTARQAATQAVEIGASPLVTRTMLSSARKEAAKNVGKYTTYSGAGASAMWGGGFDLSDQLMNIGIERPGYENIDVLRLGLTTSFSALVGGLAGRGVPRLFEKAGRNKALRQSDAILTELDRLGQRTDHVAHRVTNAMTDTDLDSLANQSQLDLMEDGIIDLTLDGPRAATRAQREAKDASESIKNNLSIEEIRNTFRNSNIELQPVFGSTKWRGRKVADFGSLPSQPVMTVTPRQKLWSWFGRSTRADSGLGRHFERSRRKFDSSLRAKEVAIHRRVDRFNEAILKDFNINKVEELDNKYMSIFDDVLRGVPSATKNLQSANASRTLNELSLMRGDILDLQKALWNSGILKKEIDPDTNELKYPLTAQIKKSIDGKDTELYLTRQFEIFDNPEWGKLIRQNPEVMEKVQSLLMGQANKLEPRLRKIHNKVNKQTPPSLPNQPSKYNYQGLTPEEIKLHQQYLGENGWMNRLISDILDIHGEDSLLVAMQDPKQIFGKNPLKILTPKGTIHDEIKLLMGEYRDPFSNYINTISKLEQTIATYNYESEIADLVNRGIIPNTSVGINLGREITAPLASRVPKGAGIVQPLEEGKEAVTSAVAKPLVGLYANKFVADAILNGNHILQTNDFLGSGTAWAKSAQGFLLGQALTRQSKTVYDTGAISRNFIGAGMMAFGAGYIRPKHIPAAMAVFKNMRQKWTNEQLRADAQKDLALGIRQSGVSIGAFRAALEDSMTLDFWTGKSPLWKDKKNIIARAHKANVKAHELYQSMDDIWKKYAFLNEHDNYKQILIDRAHVANLKSQKGIPLEVTDRFDEERLLAAFRAQGTNGQIAPDQIYNPDLDIVRTLRSGDGLNINITRLDELAADEVNRHMQNYAGVPQYVKFLRVAPVADFLAFKTELARTTKNVTIDAGREVFQGGRLWKENIILPDGTRAGTKELEVGTGRLASQIAAQSAGYAMGATSLITVGVGGEKAYDAYKSFLEGPYAKGHNFFFLGEGEKEKDGRLAHKGYAVNLSYYNPWASLQAPLRAFMRSIGRDPEGEKRYGEAISDHFIVPFFKMASGSMLANAMINVVRGQDDKGRPLWKDKDHGFKKVLKGINEFWEQFKPGIIPDTELFLKSFDKKGNYDGDPAAVKKGKYGQKYTTTDAILNYFGVAPTYYDIPRSVAIEIGTIKNNMRDSGSIFSSIVKELGPVSEDEAVEAYSETLRQQYEHAKDLFSVITRAKDAGLDTDQIYNAITGDGHFKSKLDQTILTQMIDEGIYVPPLPVDSEMVSYIDIADKAGYGETIPLDRIRKRLYEVHDSYLSANTGTRKDVKEEKKIDSDGLSFNEKYGIE